MLWPRMEQIDVYQVVTTAIADLTPPTHDLARRQLAPKRTKTRKGKRKKNMSKRKGRTKNRRKRKGRRRRSGKIK